MEHISVKQIQCMLHIFAYISDFGLMMFSSKMATLGRISARIPLLGEFRTKYHAAVAFQWSPDQCT